MNELAAYREAVEKSRIYIPTVIGCDGSKTEVPANKPWEWLAAPVVRPPNAPFYLQSATGAKIPISHEEAAFMVACVNKQLKQRFLDRDPLPSEE